ncbi:SusC/RagA family TonB-linked outer membrane protein [Chitinophaga filiformis]|uniref:TonB-linked outer membrane protein, SusC/RagA family n=1 Tax=Chitinophaga filiformis TaxID=104663 RepID=A0A1G7HEM4_CHIFI|nr:TonB-dependent receptor [Chitinophaga filiformis]SDE98811.1 TonB-linked outer membrane protein, SusC/RagA family [Chitinophaga filiformis]
MKRHVYRTFACCWLLLLLFAGAAFAQTKFTGKVTDKASGNPLPGVTVAVKNSGRGTATDPAGNFSLTAKKGEILVFSFVGYTQQEVVLGDATSVSVVLNEKVGSLDEVVVTGYATQRKKDLTGAVSVVNVEQISRQPTAQVSNQLQGQVSGITVLGSGQPGEEPQVRIRGVNTFGNNTPLYVIDGIPTQNIVDLNPYDVASMQVLKDAGSASIYGARAANGVIIITTKRGKSDGKVRVTYDGYYGTQRPKGGNVWDMLSPQEMANLKWMALKNTDPNVVYNDGLYGSGATPRLPDYIAPGGLMEGDPAVDPSKYNVNPFYKNPSDLDNFYRINKANKGGTDWFHEIFKPAMITSHNVSVSGGGDQGAYYLSFYYFNQKGTLLNTYLKRYSIRSNSHFNVGKHVRIGENLEFSVIDNPRITALTEGSGIGMAFREQPIIPVRDIKGNFAGSFSTNGAQLGNARNPVAIQERTKDNRGLGNRLLGNVYGEVDFLQHFTFRTSFGGEIYSSSNHSFTYPEYENAENNKVNSYTETGTSGYNWTWTNTLSYSQTLARVHNIKVLLGTEAFDNHGRMVTGTTQNYFIFDPNFTNLGTGTGTVTNNSNAFTDGLFSMFARLDYSLMDKYLLGAVIRRDGSSRFGANNRYGTFPAVSAGWRISQEEFLKHVSWISDLKIRGGWGIMGNQLNVNPANAFTQYGLNKGSSFYDIGGTSNSLASGFFRTTIGNPDAKWESNINTNIGFDATLFKGKLEISADYYKKQVKDLLFTPEVSATAGRSDPPAVNIAEMQNHGIDLSLGINDIHITKDLVLKANATLTTYKNKIVNISGDAPYFDLEARRFNGNFIIRNAIDHPISSFYGYKTVGFWNSAEEIAAANDQAQKATNNPNAVYQTGIKLGRFRYQDTNGDGIITDADRTFLGNPSPDFSYGLNLQLDYKNFDFTVFLYGVQGNNIWNQVRWWTDFYPSFAGAKSKTALYDSWRPDNHNAKAPIQENEGSFSTNTVPNSFLVENGSYLRAKNMMLGYTLPKPILQRIGIEKFRIYVQAANLFTITKYSGIDPEITGGTTNFGLDEGAYPNQRQFLVGVNVGF